MREWVTLLVTVTLVISTSSHLPGEAESRFNYGTIHDKEYGQSFDPTEEKSLSSLSEERSIQISKGQEKLLKDFPGARARVKHGKQDRVQSYSDFVLSEEEKNDKKKRSSESSDEERKKEKPNMWRNYARGKYGIDESVDLSILKTTVRKGAEKHTKAVFTTDKGKIKGRKVKMDDKANREVTKKIHEEMFQQKKKNNVKSKPIKQKSESNSKTIEKIELDMSSELGRNNKGNINIKHNKKKSKDTQKHKQKLESHSEVIDEMELDLGSELEKMNKKENGVQQQKRKNKFTETREQNKKKSKSEDDKGFNLFSKYVQSDDKGSKLFSPEVSSNKKSTAKKTKIKNKALKLDYDHDLSEVHTYETDVHTPKSKHTSVDKSEEYERKHHAMKSRVDKKDNRQKTVRQHKGRNKLKESKEQSKKKSESEYETGFNLFSKYVQSDDKGSKLLSHEISSNKKSSAKKTKIKNKSLEVDYNNELSEVHTYETNVHTPNGKHTPVDKSQEYESKNHEVKSRANERETKKTDTRKKFTVKPVRSKEKKAKVKTEETDEEYEFDDDLEGHTYETSSDDKTKEKHKSTKEYQNDEEKVKNSKIKKSKEKSMKYADHEDFQSYTRSYRHTESIGGRVQAKKRTGKHTDSEELQLNMRSQEGTVRKVKDKVDTTKKQKKRTGKRIKYTTTAFVKPHTTKASHDSLEEEMEREHRETIDPLEMSTEELMRHHEMANWKSTPTEITIITNDLFLPTTLKPSGTEHWICPSGVKSETIEIHWSNYDSHGQKKEMKPINPKFRNKMKRFSTKELKGRLKQVARRAQRKGEASFDASAAIKRIRFNEVFKIRAIDDDDIFRNVTYQPTCSREFEVRMLEKNYRQKYGRRQASEEQQREFENMLKFMANNSKALSEETCNRIQEEEFKKLLACCDTQEISSLMADFRDSSPYKIKYLKSKGRLPLTTSEEIEAMEKAENPEEQKRARYRAQHKNKGRLKEKDLQKVEIFKGENKDMDKEYIANTQEMNEPIVSRTEEEEETQNTQALTYFPGGRFINTEELEEMKKENEYYERMRKIGGRITRMYDPKNTLSSSEWAALEATTMKPPRWSKPAPRTKVTVRGRRKRSVSQSQESQDHSKQSQDHSKLSQVHSKESQGLSKQSIQGGNGKTTKQRGPTEDTVSEKKITVTSKTNDGKNKESREQSRSKSSGQYRNVIGTRKKVGENSEQSKAQKVSVLEETTKSEKFKDSEENWHASAKGTTFGETKTLNFQVTSRGLDEWSSISSKNSEFFLDNRKKLRKRKSTDKRYNMVVNIIKRHARMRYNRSDWYAQTLTRWGETKLTRKRMTVPDISGQPKQTFTTKIYVITPDWTYLMDKRNEKKLDAFEKSYEDLVKHAKLFERRLKGFTSDEYFESATLRPRPTNMRCSQVESLSIEPDYMADSDIMRYFEKKKELKKKEKAALFTETEEKNARATWYKMKLHQFFYKYNITKDEWKRMMNHENRQIFNATHQKYTNAKREYFVMPEDTWYELARKNITSQEFKSFNKNNRVMIRFCRGQRLNYSAKKRQITRRKHNTTKERLQDRYGAYMEDLRRDILNEEETPSFIKERTKRLRAKKNLTSEEEIYLALGGPLPYNPDFWPESFLRSHEVFQEIKQHYDDQEEFHNKDTKEKRRIINEEIIESNKKDLEFYEKNRILIQQGKMTTVPEDIWHGYTGIRKKIWEHYMKESAERRKIKEARNSLKQCQEFNEKKIEMDLEKTFNETKYIDKTKLKKNTNALKITTEKYARKRFESKSRETREYKELKKKKKKPIVGNRMTPKNEISRRERAKERDKKKYGSEYSKIVRDKYRRKSQASYYSRSLESKNRDYRRRYDSRVRQQRDRYDHKRRYDQKRERPKYASHEKRRPNDSRDRKRYVDSKDRRRKSSSSESKPKRKRINKGRPERFKKKKRDSNKKKERGKRDICGLRTTTVEPIFHESRSEYQGKMVIDAAWLVRRRAYLAEKYARLSREKIERALRKQGKLKEGETISTKKPTTPYHIRTDPINARELELNLLLGGHTKRAGYDAMETPSIDEGQYEKAELEYIKRRGKGKRRDRDSSDSDDSRTAPPITEDPGDYLYADKYAKAEDEYIQEQKRKNISSESYSYYSNVDKSYVTDHNPDYGSEERLAKLEENLIIDYKNKEVHHKNSPRIKYAKEDPTLTIPTWPTKWKNRNVRPQDRKLCFFNPSTTNQYRQVLYVYHKYKQLKEAYDKKENIDDIPSLDSDY